MTYSAQDQLTTPAKERSELWRTGLGIFALAVGSMALTALWIMVVPLLNLSGQPGATPVGMLWLLGSFLCPMATLWVVVRLLHKRGMMSLLGDPALARRQFLKVLPIPVAALGLTLILPAPEGFDLVANLDLPTWLIFLLPGLALLVVQVSAEEFVFRGYLQSQLAARFSSPLFWMVVPSVVFGLLHLSPSAGDNRWIIVAVTVMFGLVLADLTARAGTLGPAIVLHLVNNFGALILVGAAGEMQGLLLYVMPIDMGDPIIRPILAFEAALILVVWLGARVALRR